LCRLSFPTRRSSDLANGGNLELGMSIANWLSRDEAYVNIPVRTARDRGLELSPAAQATLGAAFLFLLPLGLLAGGAAVWWRRRRDRKSTRLNSSHVK